MSVREPTPPRRWPARRLWRRAATVAAVLTAAAGVLLLAQGLWIPAKAALAQVLLERAWTETRETGSAVRAWPWADAVPVARLQLPDQSLIVLSGGSGEALAFAPSHVPGSAAPGDAGTAVIAGHRDTHFIALRALAPGAPVIVERTDGTRVHYRVTKAMVVPAGDLQIPAGDRPVLALVTCWPFDALGGTSNERLVVLAIADGVPTPARRHDIALHHIFAGKI